MQKKATALLVSTGIAGAIAGGVLMGTTSANAADDSSQTSASSYAATPSGSQPGNQSGTQPGAPNDTGNPGGADPTKPMRSDEKLLTGDTKDKVTAAVKAKYPNATIQRVETDSDGVYEAHILDNGKPVIVGVDKSFSITGTQSMPAIDGDHHGDGPAGEQSTPPAA